MTTWTLKLETMDGRTRFEKSRGTDLDDAIDNLLAVLSYRVGNILAAWDGSRNRVL